MLSAVYHCTDRALCWVPQYRLCFVLGTTVPVVLCAGYDCTGRVSVTVVTTEPEGKSERADGLVMSGNVNDDQTENNKDTRLIHNTYVHGT